MAGGGRRTRRQRHPWTERPMIGEGGEQILVFGSESVSF